MFRFRLPVVLTICVFVTIAAVLAGSHFGSSSDTLGAQLGGPVFVSGDDAEDHCAGTNCGGLYAAVLKSAVNLSQSPGSGILAIDMADPDSVPALNSWNDPANGGPNVSITTVTGAAISSVDFANFDVIFVPSAEHDGGDPPGISNASLALLNGRQADIVNFVNNLGGGLIALTEQDADPNLAFGFLPIPLQFQNVDYVDAEPTAALAALAPAANGTNMDHDNWHNVWTGPPGFGGLDVLAVTPEVLDASNQPSAAILGGAQVVLRGQIDLTPDSDLNPTGTQHTVTATVLDPLDSSPVSGVDVDFEVTAGPNAGANGQGATNASGQATFAYTGSGGTGTDTIQACFVDSSQHQQCDVATKDWFEPTPSPTPAGPTPIVRDLVWGDNQCDDEANPIDSLITLRSDAGLSVKLNGCPPMDQDIEVLSITPAGLGEGDGDPQNWGNVDCDASITPVDSLKILRYDAGLTVPQEQGCPPIGDGVQIQYVP